MRIWKALAVAFAGSLTGLSGPVRAQDASTLAYQDSSPTRSAVTPLKRGANSFAESQAKRLLESKGYSDISALMIDGEGMWRGTAQKEDRRVDVSVDFQGHVASK